jgi:hypothetical protein
MVASRALPTLLKPLSSYKKNKAQGKDVFLPNKLLKFVLIALISALAREALAE